MTRPGTPRRVLSLIGAWLTVAAVAVGQVPGEVHGRVTAHRDGRAVPGARVDVADDNGHAVTDAMGAFTLRGLAPGHHDLRVHALGLRPAAVTVAVENGRSTIVTIALDALPARLAPVAIVGGADTTGSTTSIARGAIDASGARDVAGLLEQQVGLVVTRDGGPGGPAYLSVHGSSANEVLVLVDGVRVNSVLTGEADLSQIPIAQVERITIVRGAQSARYGGGALAGVVLIDTRRPTGAMLSAKASDGSWGDQDATVTAGVEAPGLASGTVTADRYAARGDFPYDVPAVRGGGTVIRQNDDAATSSISTALASTAGPIDLGLHGTLVSRARGLAGSIDAPSLSGRSSDTRTSGGLSAQAVGGVVHWTADLDAEHERTRYRDPSPPIGSPYDDHVSATSVIGDVVATIAGPIAALTVGSEARTIRLAATALTAAAPSEEHEVGLWTQFRVSRPVGDDVTLSADGAARVDWDALLHGAMVSPHVALSVARGAIAGSVGAGQSFAAPTLADQYFHEGVLVRPNPNLRPERVRGEIDARLTIRDVGPDVARLTSEVAMYRADVSGMILWFPDYRFVWSPENVDVRRAGWDGSAELAFPTVGASLHGAVSDVAVDYANPVLRGQVAYRPQITAFAAGSVTRGRIQTTIRTRYIGNRRTVQGSPINALGAYWTTDAHATIRLVDGRWPVDALGGVDDVFDRRAALLVDYPYAGRSFNLGLRLQYAGRHTGTSASPSPDNSP